MDLPSRGGRAPGSRANGSFPKGTGRLSEKSPAGYPPPHHRDDTPRERGRPARMLSLRLPLSFPAMLQPALPARTAPAEAEAGRRCRLIPVEEMGEAAGRFGRDARAPGWASSHDRVTPTGQKCRSILAPVVVEGGPSVFWSICVYSCPFVVRLHEPSAVFPRVIRPVRGQAPGWRANGSFPKGTGRLSEKSPAGYPPPHHRDDTPGSAGVPPACCPFGCRSVSLRCCSRPPCRREPHGPGRSRGRAPLPVDSGGGDG